MGNLFNLDSPIMRFLSKVADLIILNLLFIVCCVPIITIGASLTALYSVTLKMAKNEEAYIFKGFLKAFRENFKQSTIMWLILLAVGIILFLDFRLAPSMPGAFAQVFQVILMMFSAFYTLILLYTFPYVARFVNSVKNSFKNALLISILNLPFSLLIVVITIGSVFLTFLTPTTFVYGLMAWTLAGFSLVAYVNSLLFRHIFTKYEPKEETPGEVLLERTSSISSLEKDAKH